MGSVVLQTAAVLLLVPLLPSLWQPHVGVGVRAQEVPSIPCPNYFEYQRYNNEYIGRLKLPNIYIGTTRVDVQLTQRQPVVSNYYGRLSLYESQDDTLRNINNGLPVSYRVDFPISNILPKLLRITVNGVNICASSDYSLGTILNLQHTLQTSTEYQIPAKPPVTVPVTQPSIVVVEAPLVPPKGTTLNSPGQTQEGVQQPQQPQQPQPPPTATNNPETRIDTLPPNSQCGIGGTQVGATPFIHRGKVIYRGQYPWLTAIYKKQPSNLRFICAGSLISARSILTAAHCFKLAKINAQQVAVYLGRHNLEDYSEDGVVTRDVSELIIHWQYDEKKFPDADLAILRIAPVTFTLLIRPICLWNEAIEPNYVVGQMGYVAGWGSDGEGHEVTEFPKVASGAIVGDGDCARTSPVFSMLTSRRTICAGNRNGSGPCMGDSGSGLMLNRNGVWKLRGVVSAGQTENGQCNLYELVIYCDLAKHLDWVKTNMV